MATADPGVGSWTPINMFAMLRALINANVPLLTNAGAPSNGTSGTFAGQAGPGTLLIDYTNGALYQNTNTLLSPTWTKTSIPATGLPSSSLAPSVLQNASGQISSANITGTSAGQLGHANGVVLVPAAPAGSLNELVSLVIANDFSVAAYTGGGNLTCNISGGGSALTGVVSAANFITAAADKIVELVPLAASGNLYLLGANGLALVCASAPTQPGTAAGVINWFITYRTIPALLD